MKKWLFIFFLFPLLAHSQQPIITGLNRIVVGGSGGGGGGGMGVAIDTSYEVLTYAAIMNVSYNPLRPNKQVTAPSTGDLSFFMNYVPNGFGGHVRFIYTIPPNVNGIVATAFPTGPITVDKIYTEIAGTLNWN
jgi:hypothetical protein